jgi:hypothetical protein
MKRNEQIKRICENCKGEFYTRRKEARFCNTNCRVLWHYHNNRYSTVAVSEIQRQKEWPKVISIRKEMDFEICMNEDGSYLMRNVT